MYDKIAQILALGVLSGCSAVAQTDASQGTANSAQQWAGQCEPWDEWDKPAPPFKVHGNTYYVGTCGIASILITDDEGHVLLDSGTEAGARVVKRNIEMLSFDIGDVLLLGYSHEHFDHVGGMAYLQELTGGSLVSLKAGAKVMESGASDPADPQHGMHAPFAPVRVDFVHKDGDAMGTGSLLVRSFSAPGHTPGATIWQWESCAEKDGDDDCKTIVYADSMSPVSRDGYKFSDHPEYLAAYRAGIDRLGKLECDILLTPHPSHSQMVKRAATGSFEGGVTCADYAAQKHRDLDARLAKEMADE